LSTESGKDIVEMEQATVEIVDQSNDQAVVEAVDQADNTSVDDTAAPTTRSGRIIKFPEYLRENYETGNVAADDYHIQLTTAEVNYYSTMNAVEYGSSSMDLNDVEAVMVGAGVGKGSVDTNELHTITYDAAMASKERNLWKKAVEEEYKKFKSTMYSR
jgi:hypothetical protein